MTRLELTDPKALMKIDEGGKTPYNHRSFYYEPSGIAN